MSLVSLVKCNEYNEEEVFSALESVINNLGGIGKFIESGKRVLLKPNLLTAKSPEKHVTTHPAVLAGVAKILKRHKCKVFIGDSPAVGSFIKASRLTGYLGVARKLECDVVDFTGSVKLAGKNNVFKDIEIASNIKDYDAIINLPKAKTHGQMGLTLGVKNMFGCVVGTKKVHWHLRAGINKSLFAGMLVDIYSNIMPVLTITDGIIGMEGNGPQHGNPRKLGVIVASEDAVANDLVLSYLVNYDPEKLFTNIAARKRGVGKTRLDEVTFSGETLSSFERVDFKKLPASGLEFRIPSFLFGFFKNIFASKPVIDFSLCKLCNVCVGVCPAHVMENKNNKIYIDYRKCIRCFCCQEICPHGAIRVAKNPLSSIWD